MVPEEEYDHRSLFDRLEEQRRKKEYEYEETHKLSKYFVQHLLKVLSISHNT